MRLQMRNFIRTHIQRTSVRHTENPPHTETMARFGISAVILVFAVAALGGTITNPAWMDNLHKIENSNRANHSAVPLALEDGLSKMAQKWADKLALECKALDENSHSKPDQRIYKNGIFAGENIAAATYNDVERAQKEADSYPSNAGHSWYAEVVDYPWPVYKDQTLPKGVHVGHFTQQVWNGSTVVGYGLGKDPKCKSVYVVARYWPPGNMNRKKGNYGNNVFPRKKA